MSKEKGFTLLEILVALAIIGIIMGMAVGQVGKMVSRNMRKSARTLAATIQYLYNEAASEGVTLRLAFNLDEASYKVERTSEYFTLTKEEEETFSKKKKKPGNEEKGEEQNPFSIEASHLLKPVKLPKGVFFKDVYAEHQREALNSGEAYIYFFPQGYAEYAIINFRDAEDKRNISLEINPVSGGVKVSNEYKEAE